MNRKWLVVICATVVVSLASVVFASNPVKILVRRMVGILFLFLMGVAVGTSDPAELRELGIVSVDSGLAGGRFLRLCPSGLHPGRAGIRIIRRFARPVFVPYAQVRNLALRRFSGPPFAIVRLDSYPPWGFFGYFGRFKVERLGWIRVYATSRKNEMVELETDREPYFLSPVEPQRFYEALVARLCGAAG